jgi:hypothetical protein
VKSLFKSALAGVASVAIAGAGLTGLIAAVSAAPAFAAAAAPAWEPDTIGNPATPFPYGGLTFYNSTGQVITGGTNLQDLFAYAVGDSPFNSASGHNATNAELSIATPNHTGNTASWFSSPQSSGTAFPVAAASGVPTDISGDTTTPVYTSDGASGAGSNLVTSLGANDATAGFSDLAQVRVYDTGLQTGTSSGSFYWEADIAYCPTAATSACTVTINATAGNTVSVNPGSWTQVFPFAISTSVTLATVPTGTQPSGTSIKLNATVTTPENGSVSFFRGLTQIGTAQPVTTASGAATVTDAAAPNGTDSYTAVFTPTTGQDQNQNSATESIVLGPDTSNSASVTLAIPTSNTIAVGNAGPIAYGTADQLTDTVTEADGLTTGLAGNVVFYANGSALPGSSTATTVTGTGATATGVAVFSATNLPIGTDTVTAVFTPTSTAYAGGTSTNSGTVTVNAAPVCSNPGSSCSDTQNIQVQVSAGSITITTPYTAANPFVLPNLALSSDGTYLSSSATFPTQSGTTTSADEIAVTSSLAGDPGWTVSVAATALSNGATGTIPASGLGLTGGTLVNPTTFPSTVTFTNIPGHNPSAVDTDTNSGLTTNAQTWATAVAGDGTALMDGTLTLYAATNTPQGTYNGTITFSVI